MPHVNDIPTNDPAKASSTTRRTFCLHACQLASLAAVGTVLDGCGGSPTSPSVNAPALSLINAVVANGAIAITVDGGSPLAVVGSAALVRAGATEVLVTRTSQTTATALTAICTHENCTITGFLNEKFVCPCHGSQYTTEGTVANGPATRSLRQFATAIAGSTLTITL